MENLRFDYMVLKFKLIYCLQISDIGGVTR